MTNKKIIPAIIFGCVSVLTSSNLVAAPSSQVTKPLHAWKTENNVDKETGRFDNCVVKNVYDNGTIMMLGQNSQGAEHLALNFPQDKMQKGQHFDLAIQIDRKDVFPVEAVAVDSRVLTISIPEALPDQMRKGQLLHLRGPNDEVIYTMDGMDGAVPALQDCIITENNKKPASPSPAPAPATDIQTADAMPPALSKAAPQKEETKQSVQQKPVEHKPLLPSVAPAIAALAHKILPEKKIDTAADTLLPGQWNVIFAQTDLSPDVLVPLKPSKLEQPVDYIWQKKGLFIGVKEKTITPAVTLQKTAYEYLRMLKARCEGSFVAEASAIQTSKKGFNWQEAEGACSNGKKADSVAALLFVTTPYKIKVFFFEAPLANGKEAISARDSILDIIESQN